MAQRIEVGPGTYPVRNVSTGVVANIVVPALAVSVVQSAPNVGQTLTLTTNAATGAAYQWRRGATNIAGATSATYVTQGADAGQPVSCRVTSGAQAVTSAGVTVAAASSFSAVPRSHTAIRQEFQQTHTHMATIANIPSSTLVLVAAGRSTDMTDVTMTVNGVSATPLTSWLSNSTFSWMRAFQIAAPSAETVSVAVTSTGHHDHTHVVVFQIAGGAIIVADTETNNSGLPYTMTADVLAGDRLFLVAHQRDGTTAAHAVTGATIVSQLIGRTDAGSTVAGPCAVAQHTATATATPYTITRAQNDGISPNSAILIRARAT